MPVKALLILLLTTALPFSGCGDDDETPPPVEPADATTDTGDEPPLEPAPYDWCSETQPPDAACFAEKRDPASELVVLARGIGDGILAQQDPEKLHWDWGEAVMMLGLVQLYRVTGDERYQAFYRAWIDHHIGEGYEIWSSDTCAPTAVAVALIADGDDRPELQQVVQDALNYLESDALRTPEGGLNHLGTNDLFGVALWADSLFMFGNVLTGLGEHRQDAKPLDAYAEQFAIFTDLLQAESGFYTHSIYSIFEQTDGIYWGRANGWIAAAGADHLRVRRNRAEKAPEIEAAFHKLVGAIIDAQDADSGLWWTVLNRPGEGYLETSASALFIAGLARGYRYGFLGDEVLPVIRTGLAGVRSKIVTGPLGWPVVTGISGPTSVGKLDYYLQVIVDDDISYGLGAVLLALTELSGLPDLVVDPTEGLEAVPIEGTAGLDERRDEYLDACLAATGPGKGSVYGQTCRVAEGMSELNNEQIDAAIAKLDAREDTADFRAAALVRLLYLDDETGALGADRRAAIEKALLAFRYWVDEPGDDKMAYWTENHQILFHSAELLAGQRWPDKAFENSGMTGAEHVAHATPRLKRWMALRGRFGFSEWHSNVYFNEDIPALLNLVDFAEEEALRTQAAMVLDVLALDLAYNMFKGFFATTHGRTYPNKFLNGLTDSTGDWAWIVLGLGEMHSPTNFSASFQATSSYAPPPLLETLAETVRLQHEHRQRDSFTTAAGPAFGIGYDGLDDVVVWAGLAALVAPHIIDGTVEVMEAYDMWAGFLFGDLPESLTGLLKLMAGTPALVQLAKDLGPLSQGMALEAVDTYVYRTPHYQLAGAQDYKPGMWGPQTLIWQATLDGEAFALTTFPGGLDPNAAGGSIEQTFADPWTGGWYPRATLHKNVGVFQYRRLPVHEDWASMVIGDYTHARFPKAGFDEVVEDGRWVIGRKGDGYLALWSEVQATWAEDDPLAEWRAEGAENRWIVQLSSAEESGDFPTFVAAVTGAAIETGETLRFESPTLGLIEVAWSGPMLVAGAEVDIGPHERWDNSTLQQRYGDDRMLLTVGDRTLDLDFGEGTRRLLIGAPP